MDKKKNKNKKNKKKIKKNFLHNKKKSPGKKKYKILKVIS